jgi:YwqJ-like deaminase
LTSNAVVGGLASVAGGGKFANGAITGAFGYMFNSAASCLKTGVCTRDDIREGAIGEADGVFGLLFPVVGAVRSFLFAGAEDLVAAALEGAVDAGARRGTAGALETEAGVFTDVSVNPATRGPLNSALEDILDSTPVAERAPWHGACAEVGCVNQALNQGVDVSGARSVAVDIKTGIIKDPCSSCQYMLNKLGIKW